jgi:hypothetical protein
LSAAAASGSRVIVDLTGLRFMDCSAVRALADARGQALQAGGDLLLAEPRGAVSRLLSLVPVAGLMPLSGPAEVAAGWQAGRRRLMPRMDDAVRRWPVSRRRHCRPTVMLQTAGAAKWPATLSPAASGSDHPSQDRAR